MSVYKDNGEPLECGSYRAIEIDRNSGFGAKTSSFTLLVLVSVAAVTDSAEFRYRQNWSNLPKPCPYNDCKRPHEMKYSNYRQLLN